MANRRDCGLPGMLDAIERAHDAGDHHAVLDGLARLVAGVCIGLRLEHGREAAMEAVDQFCKCYDVALIEMTDSDERPMASVRLH